MKKRSNFAAFFDRNIHINVFRSGYFYGYTNAAISQDIRLSILKELLRYVVVRSGQERGEIAFLIFITSIFQNSMTGTMKDCSNANNSTVVATSAHETCKIFSFEGTIDVQVVLINGEPHFVAADVCHALLLQNPTNILRKTLEADEYLPYTVYRAGQQRLVNVVTESGLYALIFQSRKTVAKKFRKWVTSEVLPAIRKTGKFQTAPEIVYRDRPPIGQSLTVIRAGGNIFVRALLKSFKEFILEEARGEICTELRLTKKIEAARLLFPEAKQILIRSNVEIV